MSPGHGPLSSLTSRDSHTICCYNRCPKLPQQVMQGQAGAWLMTSHDHVGQSVSRDVREDQGSRTSEDRGYEVIGERRYGTLQASEAIFLARGFRVRSVRRLTSILDGRETRCVAAPERRDGGKRDTPEKTRRRAVSSFTIPACENPDRASEKCEEAASRLYNVIPNITDKLRYIIPDEKIRRKPAGPEEGPARDGAKGFMYLQPGDAQSSRLAQPERQLPRPADVLLNLHRPPPPLTLADRASSVCTAVSDCHRALPLPPPALGDSSYRTPLSRCLLLPPLLLHHTHLTSSSTSTSPHHDCCAPQRAFIFSSSATRCIVRVPAPPPPTTTTENKQMLEIAMLDLLDVRNSISQWSVAKTHEMGPLLLAYEWQEYTLTLGCTVEYIASLGCTTEYIVSLGCTVEYIVSLGCTVVTGSCGVHRECTAVSKYQLNLQQFTTHPSSWGPRPRDTRNGPNSHTKRDSGITVSFPSHDTPTNPTRRPQRDEISVAANEKQGHCGVNPTEFPPRQFENVLHMYVFMGRGFRTGSVGNDIPNRYMHIRVDTTLLCKPAVIRWSVRGAYMFRHPKCATDLLVTLIHSPSKHCNVRDRKSSSSNSNLHSASQVIEVNYYVLQPAISITNEESQQHILQPAFIKTSKESQNCTYSSLVSATLRTQTTVYRYHDETVR
ncbi:hypothetical protein PR048_002984 [Dryococelus australis]|uniref:Uncharacterized protein n=1 Tax=Dryococelus australis TaxID=614101 RepID=A0ABQ9ILP8_9NEOP|nr:hypothetical protein PR048_002984 [Dryococelus australis]